MLSLMASVIEADNLSQPSMDAMLGRQIKDVLQFLQSNRYPHVPNPPTCQKRASVYVFQVLCASFELYTSKPSKDMSHCITVTRERKC